MFQDQTQELKVGVSLSVSQYIVAAACLIIK